MNLQTFYRVHRQDSYFDYLLPYRFYNASTFTTPRNNYLYRLKDMFSTCESNTSCRQTSEWRYPLLNRASRLFAPYALWSHFRVVTILFSGKTFNLFIQFVHTENLKPVWNLNILFTLSYPRRGYGQCMKILKRLFKNSGIFYRNVIEL